VPGFLLKGSTIMTQQLEQHAEPRVRFGDGPAQELPLILAEAVLREVWKASPERFGNFLKKAMIAAWPPASANGHWS
jgi:hypothetical protein